MAIIVKQEADVVPADLGPQEDVRGVELLPLITEADGAARFSMRLFRVAPYGHTPLHVHPWEHEVFVLRGDGEVVGDAGEVPLRPGTAVYVPPGERHRFRAGAEGLHFICCVPHTDS
jgi:quercetin dioxygenase-like cupin family protein